MVLYGLESDVEIRLSDYEEFVARYVRATEAVEAKTREAAAPKGTLARFLALRDAPTDRSAA
jgi:hypothetical protein